MNSSNHLVPYPEKGVEIWDRIPLGIGGQGQEVWDVRTNPHLTIVGSAGTGKTAALRTVLRHTLQYPEYWSVLGVCVGDPELAQYQRSSKSIIGVARTLEDANTTLRFVREAVEQRYAKMAQHGVERYTQLPDRPKAILLVIDGTANVTATTGERADDKLRDAMDTNIRSILRTGQSAGVHLACTFQRPDAGGVFSEAAAENSLRYVTGQLTTPASYLVFGGALPAEQSPPGRGILYGSGFKRDIQGYYTPATWFDQHNSGTTSPLR